MKDKIDASVYGRILRTDNAEQLFDYLLNDLAAATSLARREDAFLKQQVENGNLSQDVYNRATRTREALSEEYRDEIATLLKNRKETTGEDVPVDVFLERLTGQNIGDPSFRQPLTVILDEFEKTLPKAEYDKFLSSVQSLMVGQLTRRNVRFSKHKQVNVKGRVEEKEEMSLHDKWRERADRSKRFVTGEPKPIDTVEEATTAEFTLAKEVDMVGFVTDFNNMPEELLARIYKNNPEHLKRLKQLTQIGSAMYGKVHTGRPQDIMSNVISRLSLLQKFYNINRGMVSWRFVTWDLAARQAMVNQANYLQEVLTNPNVSELLVNFVKEGSARNKLAKYRNEFKKLAIATAIQAEEQTLGPSLAKEASYGRIYVKPDKIINGLLVEFFEGIERSYGKRKSKALKSERKTILPGEDAYKIHIPSQGNVDPTNIQF